jgi:hypothetical protein
MVIVTEDAAVALSSRRWCRHWLHSESWWPKLFKDGPEIAWDDYEKDYSDLPAQVMAEHAALEGAKEVTRQLEAGEKLERDRIQARGFALLTPSRKRLLWGETVRELRGTQSACIPEP